jgi:hypothetical protein
VANDALDPGPEGDYPYWPRKVDGTPDEDRMPTGVEIRPPRKRNRLREGAAYFNLRPHDEDGVPIIPPERP